jgi:alpha-L-fucosidase
VKISEHVVITTPNLATGKPIHASSYPEGSGPDEANDGNFQTSWHLDEGLTSAWLEVDLKSERSFNVVSLVEPVGRFDDYQISRIASYRFQRWDGARWVTLIEGGQPAPATIHRIPQVTARRVRLAFESSHDSPHIADIGIYNESS